MSLKIQGPCRLWTCKATKKKGEWWLHATEIRRHMHTLVMQVQYILGRNAVVGRTSAN